MDKEGFRTMLRERKLNEETIQASIEVAGKFEEFCEAKKKSASTETAWQFSSRLIEEGRNTQENYFALARYGRFMKNNDLFVAFLEMLDGAEAQPRLYDLVAKAFGEAVRDEVFTGIGIAPLGLSAPEKPYYMQPVVERLEGKVGDEKCRRLLSGCLRDLPARYFLGERRKFRKARDIDEYISKRRRGFMQELEKCQAEGRLFFAQEINDDVLALVESDPEIESGRRAGNMLYISKIPYMARRYLAESDPEMKRYYYCHCPWAREAIRTGDVRFAKTFCYCSAGFYKKPWEVILDQPVEVDVLESVLQGGSRCRFAIHLPADAVPVNDGLPISREMKNSKR